MSIHDHSNFLSRLKNNGTDLEMFYDVGANIGSWSCEVQNVFPCERFELFEPLSGRYPKLDHRSRFSEISDYGLHPVALSDKSGPAEIKILGDRGVGSSLLVLDSDYRKDIKFLTVEQETMDGYVGKKKLRPPDFIKLDTQASEINILKWTTECLKHAKFLLLETWARRVYGPETPLFHEAAHFLYQLNYCLCDILSLEVGRDPDGTLRWFDAVFINKDFSTFPSQML